MSAETLEFLKIRFPLDLAASKPTEDPRVIKNIHAFSSRLRFVLDDNKAQNEKEFQNTFFPCGICLEEKVGGDCLRFFACGHVYCRECLGGYFTSQIESRAVQFMLCPDPKCKKLAIPNEVFPSRFHVPPFLVFHRPYPRQVRQVVSPNLFAKYEKLLLQSALEEMKDIAWCPRTVCQAPVILETANPYLAECNACRFAFCVKCKRSWHGKAPCLPENFRKSVLSFPSSFLPVE